MGEELEVGSQSQGEAGRDFPHLSSDSCQKDAFPAISAYHRDNDYTYQKPH